MTEQSATKQLKKTSGNRGNPATKGCFGSPLQAVWHYCGVPFTSEGVSLRRGSYNKTQPNGGNMIDSSVNLIRANSR